MREDCTWSEAVFGTDGYGHYYWECPHGVIMGLATDSDMERYDAGTLQVGGQ